MMPLDPGLRKPFWPRSFEPSFNHTDHIPRSRFVHCKALPTQHFNTRHSAATIHPSNPDDNPPDSTATLADTQCGPTAMRPKLRRANRLVSPRNTWGCDWSIRVKMVTRLCFFGASSPRTIQRSRKIGKEYASGYTFIVDGILT